MAVKDVKKRTHKGTWNQNRVFRVNWLGELMVVDLWEEIWLGDSQGRKYNGSTKGTSDVIPIAI